VAESHLPSRVLALCTGGTNLTGSSSGGGSGGGGAGDSSRLFASVGRRLVAFEWRQRQQLLRRVTWIPTNRALCSLQVSCRTGVLRCCVGWLGVSRAILSGTPDWQAACLASQTIITDWPSGCSAGCKRPAGGSRPRGGCHSLSLLRAAARQPSAAAAAAAAGAHGAPLPAGPSGRGGAAPVVWHASGAGGRRSSGGGGRAAAAWREAWILSSGIRCLLPAGSGRSCSGGGTRCWQWQPSRGGACLRGGSSSGARGWRPVQCAAAAVAAARAGTAPAVHL
jgi:hypothetical protein